MEELKERSQISEEFKWDLSSLFESDAQWEEKLKTLREQVDYLVTFKGKLNDADNLLLYLDKKWQFFLDLEDLFVYVSLRKSEDTRDATAQAMNGKVYKEYVYSISALQFEEPELLALSEEEFNKLKDDEKLKDYKFELEELYSRKAHTLSEKEERLLALFSGVSGAPGDIFENLQDADFTFETVKDKDGNDVELNESNYILLQMSKDRVLRENAFKAFYKEYKKHNHTLASTYSSCVKADIANATARNYESTLRKSLDSDHIPASVYDNLIDTVSKHLDTMYDYVAFRKKILKVDELHYYDVYAPLTEGVDKKYSYQEAREMVLKAVKPLGDKYVETVKNGLSSRWVDVYPNKGKSGGAYSSGTYRSNPYIMLNYTETLNDVSTLAHEMGHSMHSYLVNHTQKPQYEGYTMFVAEVASTVNENLFIEQLLKETEDPHFRLFLLNEYLEGFKGTVYRQTMFAEFEKRAHALCEKEGTLTAEALNELYLELIRKYFGDNLVIDEEVQYEWSRIPHFYRPFYVFVYATGYSSAVALSEKILNEGETAAERYLEFLRMGNSAYPLDELKHGGVDLNTPEPIDTALNKFRKVLDEAVKTATELGLI